MDNSSQQQCAYELSTPVEACLLPGCGAFLLQRLAANHSKSERVDQNVAQINKCNLT